MKNIVILISGRGSNMEAIIRAAAAEQWPARIAAVISHRADAAGLASAARAGIPIATVEYQQYPDRVSFDRALAEQIDIFQPDLVVLAGFMRILSAGFVEHYRGSLLNIHPSLLPSFPGLSTHRRAIEAGVHFHGATVHFVTQELDHGPIVAQAVVPVLHDDTEDTLAARVLIEEHRIYPAAVRGIIEGRIRLVGDRVRHDQPLESGA
ncbi:MAG: phosphoribosylglycinamide formyltransferase [Betaproteobacteria bacterium]